MTTKEVFKPPFARVRGEESLFPAQVATSNNQRTYKNAPPTSVITYTRYDLPHYVGEVMSDIVTPGYREKQSRGQIINNAMSKRFGSAEVEPWSGRSYYSVNTNPNLPSGSIITDVVDVMNMCPNLADPNWPSIPQVDQTACRNDAINTAFAAAKQQDVMGIVDLVEMPKTVDLILTQVGRLKKLSKPFRRRKPKAKTVSYTGVSPAGKIADAGGLWLELQYGILPTMMSLEGLINALTKPALPHRSTHRGYRSTNNVVTERKKINQYGWMSGDVPIGFHTYERRYEYAIRSRAGLITEFIPSMKQRLGLTLNDLPSTAYELIPFSFVVDWWYDLGTYLQAVTPPRNMDVLASWVTTTLEEYSSYIYSNTGGSQSASTVTSTYYPQQCAFHTVRRSKIRTPGVSPGLPTFDPQFRSWKHAVSSVALAFSLANPSRYLAKIIKY